jgi:hypothetical protein
VKLLNIAASFTPKTPWLTRSGKELSMASLQEQHSHSASQKTGYKPHSQHKPIRENRNRRIGWLSSKIIIKLTKAAQYAQKGAGVEKKLPRISNLKNT